MIELLDLPPPFAPEPMYSPQARFASPSNGDLTGRAKLARLFPETFVLDASTGQVTIYGESASTFTVSVDAEHRWAPDGSAVVFKRHQTSGCCSVWVLLHPATGVLDTLERSADQVPYMFGWFGGDTLLSWRPGTAPTHYRALALATRDTVAWSVVPFNGFRMPTASLDRRWIAHWSLLDSTVAGEGTVQFVQMRLRARHIGADTLLLTARNYSGPTTLSETFDPDSRFLAYCTTFTNIRIRELATGRTVKDLTVPFCYALSWSWGPEGPPRT
ncbi:MAG: hypothetical protein ABI542_08330 [Gemmatimonadota bacterium]